MTTPSGLLMYGQAQTYNAIDDRNVISGLASGRIGIQQAPVLSAGTGLVINIGPWRAIVDCGDGTSAVVGSLATTTITTTAAGTGGRTDILWCDINVNAGTWQLALITAAQAVGRTGIQLGTITAPANANTSAAMTFAPALPTFAVSPGLIACKQSNAGTGNTGTAFTTDPELVVPVEPRTAYLVSMCLIYQGGQGASAGMFGFGWVAPAGVSGNIGLIYRGTSNAWLSQGQAWTAATLAAWTDGLGSQMSVWGQGVLITGANGGPFAVRWRRSVNTDTQSTIYAGSTLALWKHNPGN